MEMKKDALLHTSPLASKSTIASSRNISALKQIITPVSSKAKGKKVRLNLADEFKDRKLRETLGTILEKPNQSRTESEVDYLIEYF